MPKTRDAFAFRGFDSERILQRPYFKEFDFDADKSDAQILQTLRVADDDTVDDMEEKLHVIKATHERLGKYRQLINRHYQTRCDKYNKRKAAALGIKVSELKRPARTLEYFTEELSCLELMEKFGRLYYEVEKMIQARYRKEFTARLKQARLKAGLKQKELGDLVQVSPQGFSLYERGERDIPIHTVIRLAKVLDLSGDQILGLK